MLIYAQPLLVAALARGFLGERLRRRQVLGLLTGWLGVGLAIALADGTPVDWTGRLLLSTFHAAAVSLAGGYLLQFALLRHGDAGVVSSHIFAVPVPAAVFGVVVFDERLSVGLGAGATAVAAGILLVTLPARRGNREPAQALIPHPG